MVLYAMPRGEIPLKEKSPEQLSPAKKTGTPRPLQGFNVGAPQWQRHNALIEPQATSLPLILSPHRHSPFSRGQSSLKLEHQEYGERERDAPTEEFAHGRKRFKIQDSVHGIASQIHSQLMSPREMPRNSGPTSIQDSAGLAFKYESHHFGDRSSQTAGPPPRVPCPVSLNPLDEPSPLGLTLRKTPSLLDLISMKLGQGGVIGDQESTNPDSLTQDSKNRASKCLALSRLYSINSKHPISLLQVLLLVLGRSNMRACVACLRHQRASRYEGDLVGKCYYAKRKLVWEVLESGLKSKIEIQWSDISAMKANCPDNLPGTLEIEVSRAPLFFRETDPQPRKHTLWQACSDFTGGQATSSKCHLLQFPEGVLNRPYEKLVQCDPRLKALVQGTLSLKRTDDLEQSSWLYNGKHQHLPTHNHQPTGHPKNSNGGNMNLSSFTHSHMTALPCNPAVSNLGIIPDNMDVTVSALMKMQSNELASPSSVMDAQGSGASDIQDVRLYDDLGGYDGVGPKTHSNVTSIGGLLELPDVKPSCNNLFMIGENAQPPDQKILNETAHVLLGESASISSSDHSATLAGSVQGVSDDFTQEFHPVHPPVSWKGHACPIPISLLQVKSEVCQGDDDQMNLVVASSGDSGRLPYNPDNGNSHLSKCDSTGDLLVNLPQVTFLPHRLKSGTRCPC